MSIRLLLIITLLLLQSCSNTLIGEKLENSFNIADNKVVSGDTTPKGQNKLNEKKNIKSIQNDSKTVNYNSKANIKKEIIIANKDRPSQKSTKSIKKVLFNPQPYRIILRLSGANPSAPAESVTKALRKAGVQFEVEKIERFEEGKIFKDTSFKRKEFWT